MDLTFSVLTTFMGLLQVQDGLAAEQREHTGAMQWMQEGMLKTPLDSSMLTWQPTAAAGPERHWQLLSPAEAAAAEHERQVQQERHAAELRSVREQLEASLTEQAVTLAQKQQKDDSLREETLAAQQQLAELQAGQRQLQEGHAAQLGRVQSPHAAELSALREQLATAQQEMQRLQEQHKSAVHQLKQQQRELRELHAAELQHAEQLNRDSRAVGASGDHNHQQSRLQQQGRELLQAQQQLSQAAAQLEQVQQQHVQATAFQQEQHKVDLASLRQSLQGQHAADLASAKQLLDQRAAELRNAKQDQEQQAGQLSEACQQLAGCHAEHASAQQRMREQHSMELAALQQGLQQQHTAELSVLEVGLGEQHAEELAQIQLLQQELQAASLSQQEADAAQTRDLEEQLQQAQAAAADPALAAAAEVSTVSRTIRAVAVLQYTSCCGGLLASLPSGGTCMCLKCTCLASAGRASQRQPCLRAKLFAQIVQANPLIEMLHLLPCACLRSAAWLPLQGAAALRKAAEQAQATAARQHELLLAAENDITGLQVGCLAAFPGAPSSLFATMASISTTTLCCM